MLSCLGRVSLVVLAAAGPAAAADKMAPEFRAAWDGSVRKGHYAVVTAQGVPTTSVYGVDGQQAEAYYSVDVKGADGRTAREPVSTNFKVGMTPLEVLDALGKPAKATTFQAQSKWTYPELTILFENGRVKEVRF